MNAYSSARQHWSESSTVLLIIALAFWLRDVDDEERRKICVVVMRVNPFRGTGECRSDFVRRDEHLILSTNSYVFSSVASSGQIKNLSSGQIEFHADAKR